MGLFRANGTRVTKANLVTVAVADPEVVINEDLHETFTYNPGDDKPAGSLKRLHTRAGKRTLRQSQIDQLFQRATVTSLSPATGPAVGGTVVTITGTNLDGVTAVSFDGAAGTALTVLSATKLRVTTPVGVAGPADVALTDDVGPVTKTAAYTYA